MYFAIHVLLRNDLCEAPLTHSQLSDNSSSNRFLTSSYYTLYKFNHYSILWKERAPAATYKTKSPFRFSNNSFYEPEYVKSNLNINPSNCFIRYIGKTIKVVIE